MPEFYPNGQVYWISPDGVYLAYLRINNTLVDDYKVDRYTRLEGGNEEDEKAGKGTGGKNYYQF